MVSNAGLTPTTAAVINGNYTARSAKEYKQAVQVQLGDMLRNGQVSEADYKAALDYLDNNLVSALARRNNVEGIYGQSLNGLEDLEDKKANKLMHSVGLTIDDLYQAAKLAGPDRYVNYTCLGKEELFAAEKGEITASEIKNIQNYLNAKIKENGGDKVLNDKEVTQLMEGLGLTVESRFSVKVVFNAIKNGIIGFGGKSDDMEAKIAQAPLKAAAFLGGGIVPGLAAGAVLNTASELNDLATRREKGTKNSDGTVTNPTEAKMDELGKMTDIANSQSAQESEQEEKPKNT